jgi:YfiH family protein
MAETLATDCIVPDWPAPAHVRTLVTSRNGGVSRGPYAGAAGLGGLNLGTHVGDDPVCVARNRARLRACLPGEPVWLDQVHGTRVLDLDGALDNLNADAAVTRRPGVVAVIMMADCLPVFLTDRQGSVVAVAHAGWRGLAGGVLEAALAAMQVAPDRVLAWLGPAIGPAAFEVGRDVLDAFVATDAGAAACFVPGRPGKWLADLPGLAQRRLERAGVAHISGGRHCTVADAARFYSYRRDGVCGRMAALAWLTPVS